VTVEVGRSTAAGALELLPTNLSSGNQSATLLVRGNPQVSAEAAAQQSTLPPATINASLATRAMTVTSDSPRSVEFARVFLEELNAGRAPQAARTLARSMAAAPRVAGRPVDDSAGPRPRSYVDATNVLDAPEVEGALPHSALVTFHLVRGELSAINELSSSWQYDSTGRSNPDPPVRVRGGGDGADVRVGRPGDRFRYKLRALEAERRANVQSESFIRVMIGGHGDLRISGPGGQASAYVHVRRAGRSAVELAFDHFSGDWSFVGSANSRLRVSDGRTVLVAKNTYSRT
jgi:hypothetical protein